MQDPCVAVLNSRFAREDLFTEDRIAFLALVWSVRLQGLAIVGSNCRLAASLGTKAFPHQQ
jgi:hypothetical protein